jgi:hypothetical protein
MRLLFLLFKAFDVLLVFIIFEKVENLPVKQIGVVLAAVVLASLFVHVLAIFGFFSVFNVHFVDIAEDFAAEVVHKIDFTFTQDHNALLKTVEHSFELVFNAETELDFLFDFVLEVHKNVQKVGYEDNHENYGNHQSCRTLVINMVRIKVDE